MRILTLFSLIILLFSCSGIEVAKEVSKATKSIKTSVNNIVKNTNDVKQPENLKEIKPDKDIMDQEIASLEEEKKEKQEIITEQKKKTKINFLNKTFKEIILTVGEPNLMRIDGNSKIVRFDNRLCQLFLFSNLEAKNNKVKYFEIRNKKGSLIINEEKIQKCYKGFNLI